MPERQHSRPAGSRNVALAAALVAHGVFADEDEARRWIMAGHVFVNEQRMTKPGMQVRRDARIAVHGLARYASRGGYKLAAALDHFAAPVQGQTVLDCGASTGGFTDCLLQHGAALVYAVEAGFGQLVGRLQADPRVRNWERTNLSAVLPGQLDPRPTLVTLDLSYLSLTDALPVAASLLAPSGTILALVKPLFEVRSSEARRTGQIAQPELVVEALRRVIDAGTACGLTIQGVVKLALQPRHGVHEFFAGFARAPGAVAWPCDAQRLQAICAGPGIGPQEPDELRS